MFLDAWNQIESDFVWVIPNDLLDWEDETEMCERRKVYMYFCVENMYSWARPMTTTLGFTKFIQQKSEQKMSHQFHREYESVIFKIKFC